MSPVLEKIEKEAFGLSDSERELLANHLFQSVHPVLTEHDNTWLKVAEERYQAYLSGKETALPEDEFFQQVEAELGWK